MNSYQIFKHYLNVICQFVDFNIEEQSLKFAKLAEKRSGADIRDFVDEAKKRAFALRRGGRSTEKVTIKDVERAIQNLPMSR